MPYEYPTGGPSLPTSMPTGICSGARSHSYEYAVGEQRVADSHKRGEAPDKPARDERVGAAEEITPSHGNRVISG